MGKRSLCVRDFNWKARKLPTFRQFLRGCEGSYQTKCHLKTSTEVRRCRFFTQSWGQGFHLGVNCGESKGVEPGIFLFAPIYLCWDMFALLINFLALVWWQYRQCTSHKLTKSRLYVLLPNRFSGCKRKAIEWEGMSGNKGLAKTTAMYD